MKNQLGHIIGAQEYQIGMADQREAHQVQSAVSSLQETRVNALLEQIMDQFAQSDSIYRFDKIELDLGVISKTNYEDELVLRLEEQFTAFFRANIRGNNVLNKGKVIQLDNHKLKQFEYFLLHGYLTWNSFSTFVPSTLFKELLVESKKELVALLLVHGKKAVTRKRMIYQFSDEVLDQVVVAVAKSESDYIIDHKNKLQKNQQKHRTLSTDFGTFRNAVWEIILAYLFVESKSYYNKKSFLKYLIKKVADKYNLTYALLLEGISEGIEKEHDAARPVEFRKILLELQHEELDEAPLHIRKHKKKEDIRSLLNGIDSYFSFGDFPLGFTIGTKANLNKQLLFLLETKSHAIAQCVTRWFQNKEAKKRVLCIVDDTVLTAMLKLINQSNVLVYSQFVQALVKTRSKLSVRSKNMLDAISMQEARLIVRSPLYGNYSQKEAVHSFLTEILLHFDKQEILLFKLFEEVEQHLITVYKNAISLFLIKFYHKTGENVLQQIVEVIVSYTNETREELWSPWMALNMSNWLHFTGLTKKELLRYVERRVNVNTMSPRLVRFLHGLQKAVESKNGNEVRALFESGGVREVEKGLKLPIEVIDLLVKSLLAIDLSENKKSNWSQEVLRILQLTSKQYHIALEVLFINVLSRLERDNSATVVLEKLKVLQSSPLYKRVKENEAIKKESGYQMELVSYVLIHGVLPWWVTSYSWNTFNTELAKFWKVPKLREQLVTQSKQGTPMSILFRKLTTKNIQSMWESLDGSSEKKYSNVFVSLDHVINEELLPLGLFSSEEKEKFRAEIFLFFLKGTSGNVSQSVVQLLERWVGSSEVVKNKRTSIILLEKLLDMDDTILPTSLRDQIKKRYKTVLRGESDTIADSDASMQATSRDTMAEEFISRDHAHVLKGINATLEDFLIAHALKVPGSAPLQERLSESQVVQLLELNKASFKEWLVHKTFRKSVLSYLDRKTLAKMIASSQSETQQQQLKESLKVLSRLKLVTPKGAFSTLYDTYFELLLLKTGTGGFSSWNAKDWIQFLFGVLERIFGKQKSVDFLLSAYKEELEDEKGASFEGNGFINELFNMALTKDMEDPRRTIPGKNKGEKGNDIETVSNMNEEEQYKKLGEETPHQFNHPIFIQNAGVIIIAPYLSMLFERCGLLKNGDFIDLDSKRRAVHLIEYAVTGEENREEHQLVINKVLCGLPVTWPIERFMELTKEEKETVDSMLGAVMQQWSALERTSIDGLRTTFLQRDGKLEEEEGQFYLKVEQKAFDMLLDRIPWNISMIKLSWMEKMIVVEWR